MFLCAFHTLQIQAKSGLPEGPIRPAGHVFDNPDLDNESDFDSEAKTEAKPPNRALFNTSLKMTGHTQNQSMNKSIIIHAKPSF